MVSWPKDAVVQTPDDPRPSLRNRFFGRVVDAQFEIHVEGDRATSLTLYQNGRQVDAKRVDDP
jgi:hypothetical protein